MIFQQRFSDKNQFSKKITTFYVYSENITYYYNYIISTLT